MGEEASRCSSFFNFTLTRTEMLLSNASGAFITGKGHEWSGVWVVHTVFFNRFRFPFAPPVLGTSFFNEGKRRELLRRREGLLFFSRARFSFPHEVPNPLRRRLNQQKLPNPGLCICDL